MVKKINSSKTKKTGNLKKKEEIQKELPQEHLAVQDISDDSSEEEDTLDKTNANKRSRIAKAQKDIDTLKEIEKNTGVIYVGHLPWGFLDEGLKKYFDQFGQIERLLVPRSKKVLGIF